MDQKQWTEKNSMDFHNLILIIVLKSVWKDIMFGFRYV